MKKEITKIKSWQALYSLASGQQGYFGAWQAAELGCSPQLLRHHERAGNVQKATRGIYRLVDYPDTDHEEFVVVWLWSKKEAVFSHQTGLALHELSDALPSRIHVTLPSSWSQRRVKMPTKVAPHYGDVSDADRVWFGPLPVTSPVRTVVDCAQSGLAPDLIRQAIDDGRTRGLFDETMLAETLSLLNSI